MSKRSTVCDKIGVEAHVPIKASKLGIALNTIGKQPINGLRHPCENETNGWYIWCGEELSNDEDFFSPLHVEHISEYLPEVMDYLNLPPGYRFLINNNKFEDVWFDENLIKPEDDK